MTLGFSKAFKSHGLLLNISVLAKMLNISVLAKIHLKCHKNADPTSEKLADELKSLTRKIQLWLRPKNTQPWCPF